MTVLAYGGGHFVAAVSLAASVIYHHYLILVSGEVLYELIQGVMCCCVRFLNRYNSTQQ